MDGSQALKSTMGQRMLKNSLWWVPLLVLSATINGVAQGHHRIEVHWSEIVVFSLFNAVPKFAIGYWLGKTFSKSTAVQAVCGLTVVLLFIGFDLITGRLSLFGRVV